MEKKWTKEQIEDVIRDFNTRQGGSAGGFTVPFHRHNGSDMVRINLSDTLPWNFVSEAPTFIAPNEGMMYLFNTPTNTQGDAGMYIYLNGNWNYNSYVADGVFAYLSAPQTIASGSPTTIVFDTVEWDDSGVYDATTGKYGPIEQGGKYLISAQATFETHAPDVTLELDFVVYNGSTTTVEHKSFVPDHNGEVSITMTLVKSFGVGITFWFDVLYSGPGSRDLEASNTFLSVKKFSN